MKRFKPESFPPRAVATTTLSRASLELFLSSFPACYLSFAVPTSDVVLAKGLIREWRFRLNKRLDNTNRTHIIGEAVSGWASFECHQDHVIVHMLVGLDTHQPRDKHLDILRRSITTTLEVKPDKIVPVANMAELGAVQAPSFARDMAEMKADSFGVFGKSEG